MGLFWTKEELESIAKALHTVAWADGKIVKEEEAFIKEYCAEHHLDCSEHGFNDASQMLFPKLNANEAFAILRNMQPEYKKHYLIDCLKGLAECDGHVHENENRFIASVLGHIGIKYIEDSNTFSF